MIVLKNAYFCQLSVNYLTNLKGPFVILFSNQRPVQNFLKAEKHSFKSKLFSSGRSLSLGGSGSFGGSGSTGGGGGGGIGGRSIREFDETVRELRKENFNLKLRIYFLEERLGTSRLAAAAAGSKEELVQSNYELKVRSNCSSVVAVHIWRHEYFDSTFRTSSKPPCYDSFTLPTSHSQMSFMQIVYR